VVSTPRAVIAAPLYSKADYLPRSIESLLAQTEGDFALLLVDDCSTDATQAVAERYAASDPRVTYHRNPERLGMIANKRRCYQLARERFPDLHYFAWGTDHDIWRPGWLEELTAALDEYPEAVLAYPRNVRIDGDGNVVREPWVCDTLGQKSARRRVQRVCYGINAGTIVYGLYRAQALERAAVMRFVLNPDRLLMLELAAQGEFVQVPQVLWERRFVGLATTARQRAAFFPRGAPLSTRIPSWITHASVFLWTYAIRAAGRPGCGRWRGLVCALEIVRSTSAVLLRRRLHRVRKSVGRRRKEAHRRRREGRTTRRDLPGATR
jgi:Glycosyl transferase family 2